MAILITLPTDPEQNLSGLFTVFGTPTQRLFWITDVPTGASRGRHRHPDSYMFLQCPVGSVNVYVQTPTQDLWYRLDSPNQCLLLDPQDWRMMYDFSSEAVLVIQSNTSFDQTGYLSEPYRFVEPDRRVV